jgi:hypothetical protein
MRQAGDSDCGPEGPGWLHRAADGQQPVFVTIGEPARKPWRIMTADSAIDGHWPGVSHMSSQSSTERSSLRDCPVQISHGGSEGFKSLHLHISPGQEPGGSLPLADVAQISPSGHLAIPRSARV